MNQRSLSYREIGRKLRRRYGPAAICAFVTLPEFAAYALALAGEPVVKSR